MSKFEWILGGLKEISFKRAQDGWVFRSPSIWPRRTYLMTDAQKVALVKPLRRMLMVQFGMIIVLVVVSNLTANYEPWTRWLVFGIATVVLIFLSWLYVVFALRPQSAGARELSSAVIAASSDAMAIAGCHPRGDGWPGALSTGSQLGGSIARRKS